MVVGALSPFFMSYTSKYDTSRENAGKIYRDLQLDSHDDFVINGDITNELSKSLVDDINDAIIEGTKDFESRPFYLVIHEKKDLMMPRAILRRIIKMEFRPWPEDDLIVFRSLPALGQLKFCWCLPHHTEMDNMLMNENLFDPEMISQIKAWKVLDLYHFGFCKDSEGNWQPNPHYEDKDVQTYRQRVKILLPSAV